MHDRQLRIAPVMTGGTSLAVWMGGVTAELYAVARGSRDRVPVVEPSDGADIDVDADVGRDKGDYRDVYRRLMDLTRTSVEVDVITGTSAGGLNGVLLAAALKLGVSAEGFLTLRDTWMDVADLQKLMRSPQEPNPPSLLRGDQSFLPAIDGLLRTWEAQPGRRNGTDDLDLVTTVTTLVPEPRYRADDFGEPMHEASHAQCLRFTEVDFGGPHWKERLAKAARTSASIPGVFEPSYLKVEDPGPTQRDASNLFGNASFGSSRWAVDGGVVVNLPLTEALDRIFDRSAVDRVRRVVLYVCPTPATLSSVPGDTADRPPLMKDSLLAVVTAPRAEGVSADIDRLHERNAAVERQALLRRHLKPMVDEVLAEAGSRRPLFDEFKRRRAEASVSDTLEAVWGTVGTDVGPDHSIRAALLGARSKLFGAGVASTDEALGDADHWAWGIRPVEQAISIALRLLDLAGDVQAPEPQSTPGEVDPIGGAKSKLFDALTTVNRVRELDREHWTKALDGLKEELKGELRADANDRGTDVAPIRAKIVGWANDAYGDWLGYADGAESALNYRSLEEAHERVAAALIDAYPALAEAAANDPSGALGDELATLGMPELVGASNARKELQRRLLAVHVAQTVVLGEVIDREQPAELMQISFNSPNVLDPARSPADKLAGPELGRLGAFLKPSWRANDWLWGRLDGSYRLLTMLADPARLRELYATLDDAERAVGEVLGGGALPDAVRLELERLYSAAGEEMRSLPSLVEQLAGEVQVAIAREELPMVAAAIERSHGNELGTRAFTRLWHDAQPASKAGPTEIPADTIKQLVRNMEIGRETVRSELGFGPLNRIMTRGASVLVNALTGSGSGIPVVPRLLRPARAPLHATASLVSMMAGPSPLSRAFTAFVLAVAGAIVSLRLVGVDVPTGTFAISGILLTGLIAVAMVRSGFWWLSLCVVLGAGIIGLTLTGSDMETVVYGDVDRLSAPEDVDGEPASTFQPGDTVSIGEGIVLEIVTGRGSEERTQTIEAPAAGIIRFRQAGTIEADGPARTESWKRWGFVNPRGVTVFQVVVGAAVLVLGLRAWQVRPGRERSLEAWKEAAWRAALAVGLGLVVWRSESLFESMLTGGPSDSRSKRWLVDTARALEGYSLEVVLLVIVGASVLLALGTDKLVNREAVASYRWVKGKLTGGRRPG